jgi:hypothetical protein
MQSKKSFKYKFVYSMIIIILSSLFISQAVFASGYIKIWGEYVFDGREFDCNDFVAIDAGYEHSLAIKEDGSVQPDNMPRKSQGLTAWMLISPLSF